MNHFKQAYPKRYQTFFRRILPIYIGYKVKIVPEKKMKYLMMHHYVKAMNDLTAYEQREFFEAIFEQMKEDVHKEVVERLESHRTTGFHTMIVSGAFTILL